MPSLNWFVSSKNQITQVIATRFSIVRHHKIALKQNKEYRPPPNSYQLTWIDEEKKHIGGDMYVWVGFLGEQWFQDDDEDTKD